MKSCLCIFGFGYTAAYLAALCQDLPIRIIGTSRNAANLRQTESKPYELFDFSASAFETLNLKPTHLLISTPPTAENGDPVIQEFKNYLAKIRSTLQWIGYLSTTGVYGDHQGKWVDENTAPHHPSATSQARLAAEADWLHFADQHQLPCFIFRIAGIYGPYRNALQQLKTGKPFSVFKKDQVFSRIHVEDLARAIKAALFQPEQAGIYNLSDDEPAPSHQVDAFAASLLGLAAPPLLPIEKATLSSMALEFYKSNRRVSNAKMKEKLEIVLKYPTYREGLKSLFEQNLY